MQSVGNITESAIAQIYLYLCVDDSTQVEAPAQGRLSR